MASKFGLGVQIQSPTGLSTWQISACQWHNLQFDSMATQLVTHSVALVSVVISICPTATSWYCVKKRDCSSVTAGHALLGSYDNRIFTSVSHKTCHITLLKLKGFTQHPLLSLSRTDDMAMCKLYTPSFIKKTSASYFHHFSLKCWWIAIKLVANVLPLTDFKNK